MNVGILRVFLINLSALIMNLKCDQDLALIFDQRYHDLFDVKTRILSNDIVLDNYIAIACPAHTAAEIQFNENKSFGNNSLFVQRTLRPTQHIPKLEEMECSAPYKMSIIYHKMSKHLQFGYEVYYDLNLYGGFVWKSNYARYDSVTNAFSKMNDLENDPNADENSELSLNKNELLNFIWILRIYLVFDTEKNRPKHVIYTQSKPRETGVTCTDYSLGNEIYQKRDIDVDSSYKNQNGAFENVKIPTSDPIDEHKEMACGSQTYCLMKWSLIPSDEFRVQRPQDTSCSNLVTVPIWNTIAKQTLDALDKSLYALNEIIKGNLKIVSGVHGDLVMPTTGFLKSKTIRIGNNGKITVPSIIYKIIKYDDIVDETKAIIILVHNDPYFNGKDGGCSKSKCEKLGWTEVIDKLISSEGRWLNYMYCCPRNQKTAKKIDALYNDDEETKELDLKNFPLYQYNKYKTSRKIIVQNVIDKMKTISGRNQQYPKTSSTNEAELHY